LTIIKSILINFESILIILYFVKLLGSYRGERLKEGIIYKNRDSCLLSFLVFN